MVKGHKATLYILLLLGFVLIGVIILGGFDVPVLFPKGSIAVKERDLIMTSTYVMLIVVIPVYILTLLIMWKYRADNPNATFDPAWDYSLLAESIWWGFPLAIIIALSVICWKSTHELDPFKPIDPHVKPVRIQVVALQWKWLFLYPEEKIATVNFVQFPEKVPLKFEISADAPMNSFWIPALGGQIYAMPGMKSQLHLIADEVGLFRGSSANLSGKGFASMNFKAKASSEEEFKEWVQSIQGSGRDLDWKGYEELVKPSERIPPTTYVLKEEDLFERVLMKYMSMPMPEHK